MTMLATGDRRITLFEGERNHLLPLHSTDALESNLYFYVGRMIAHTFLHKGYPFVGMAQAVVQYIFSQSIESIPLISIKDVPDLTIRQDIEKIMNPKSDKLLDVNACDKIITLLSTSGFVNKVLTTENQEKAVQDILVYHVLRI
ncbi:Hypothetical predicted protein [Paramuricea clavata]|uniref:Uncharacterized protein n=1 Tax=Paramuricea clavata TaxID=317549 RepID=A0A6S7FL44_PARCT|nr:Hypothetical predicted protein [Paramuricea clavata]